MASFFVRNHRLAGHLLQVVGFPLRLGALAACRPRSVHVVLLVLHDVVVVGGVGGVSVETRQQVTRCAGSAAHLEGGRSAPFCWRRRYTGCEEQGIARPSKTCQGVLVELQTKAAASPLCARWSLLRPP